MKTMCKEANRQEAKARNRK